jgi:hypothetical protein
MMPRNSYFRMKERLDREDGARFGGVRLTGNPAEREEERRTAVQRILRSLTEKKSRSPSGAHRPGGAVPSPNPSSR